MWKNFYINNNQIETETSSAVLIKAPHNSRYDGYKFWHPSKLVRNSYNGKLSVGYTDSFKITLKKYGNGKYNKFDIIDEIEITGEELEEIFE